MAIDDTQERLLDAAGKVFAEKGYEGATVREIVRRAEIKNIAAVNYYFGDQEKLYDAALRHAFKSRTDQLPVPAGLPGTPPAVKLRELIHAILIRMMEIERLPWQAQLLMRELQEPSNLAEGLVRDYIRPIYEV